MEQKINVTGSQDVQVIQAGGDVDYHETKRPLSSEDNRPKTPGARGKVFISSTCFDLKDLRAELAEALKEWGYLPVWNESPDFPKKPGLHSHDLCLDAVKECDIYLLIIDKRYGGSYAGNKYPKEEISITWYETKIAFQEQKEIHTFVRDEVWNERPTYKKNLTEGVSIKPHHVDNPEVFDFIDYIVHQPRDNWIDQFKDSVNLKEKLRIRLKGSTKREIPFPHSLHNQTPPEENFVGRKEMLKTITQWYQSEEVRIGALIGWGGVGKSALIRKWYDTLSENNIQPDGIFWWGFYGKGYANLERFLDSLLKYLAQGRIDLKEIKGTWEKVEKIKEFILGAEYLIVLDGLEEMQKGISGDTFGALTHPEFAELLRCTVDLMDRGMCLITTRYSIKDLNNWIGSNYEESPISDLELKDAKALLTKRNIRGEEKDLKEVIQRYKGHALALTSLAGYLNRYYKGDIRKSPDVHFVFDEAERWKDVNKLFRRYVEKMTTAEVIFLKLFSLFRTEVTERDFAEVFRKPIEGIKLNQSMIEMKDRDFIDLVDGLVEWRLISCDEEEKAYTTHPLTKGYFESIFEEEDNRLCHKRIYEYIGSYAPGQPETLEEMQPLFEQVYHGCAAGLYQEAYGDVYRQKVQRGEDGFLIYKLGSWETNLSLIQNFFPNGDFQKEPLVTKIRSKCHLINAAGLSMMMLDRSKEAEKLYKKAIDLNISQRDWKNASVGYQNLAGLQIRTGNLLEAKKGSEEAIRLSREAENVREECFSTAYLAYTLFLLGDIDKAEIKFEKAGELQRRADPSKRYLYSGYGIWYADFLLSQGKIHEALYVTNENLKICERNNWINDINLCYLSLASICRHLKDFKEAEANAGIALEGVRKTGRQDIEAEALIELARIRLDQGQYPEAESILNQALRICQRCGYRLYEVDAELILSRVYLGLGELDKAKDFANSAYTKAKGMSYYLARNDAEQLSAKSNQAKIC